MITPATLVVTKGAMHCTPTTKGFRHPLRERPPTQGCAVPRPCNKGLPRGLKEALRAHEKASYN